MVLQKRWKKKMMMKNVLMVEGEGVVGVMKVGVGVGVMKVMTGMVVVVVLGLSGLM
jgi:hypothetical protein